MGPATTVVQAASSDQPILNIPHQAMFYDASIHNGRIFIFSLKVSRALLMSPLSSKFPKAAKLFFIVT
jgi:hypothetical protein